MPTYRAILKETARFRSFISTLERTVARIRVLKKHHSAVVLATLFNQQAHATSILKSDRSVLRPAPTCEIRDENCLILGVDEFGALYTTLIIFDGVKEDSRCPLDGDCVQAGKIIVGLSINDFVVPHKQHISLGFGKETCSTFPADISSQLRLVDVWPDRFLDSASNIPYRIKLIRDVFDSAAIESCDNR